MTVGDLRNALKHAEDKNEIVVGVWTPSRSFEQLEIEEVSNYDEGLWTIDLKDPVTLREEPPIR